tara:strand:+ start:1546 stop:1866 length:321 start_codon:yes stop_codon:yes gene_type:complete
VTPFRRRALTFGLVVGAYLLGTSHAQDTGTPPPVRIAPVSEYLPSLRTDREGVRSTLAWSCELLFGEPARTQPPAHPSDCRTEITGRNQSPAEGEENGTGATRGEL